MAHPLYYITRFIKATGDNAPKLQQILDDHRETFDKAQGSTHNHQAWPGGYLQHVWDTLHIANCIWSHIDWPMPFEWSSVVLVLFLHDIEKPFMQERLSLDKEMPIWSKQQREAFRMEIIAKYEIILTPEEHNALTYIHGEGDDYSPKSRVMNELGALCHAADILSSRLWHNREKPQ